MYTEQKYKSDREFIERIESKVTHEIVFFLYFLPLVACLAAHVLYLVLFALAGIRSMVIFNVFSVTFYGAMIVLSRKVKETLNLVYVSMTEIILHAAAATVCVGLKPDFCMFLLMIIPLAFLVPNKNKQIPFIVLFVSVPLYGILRFIYLVPGKELYDISDNSYMSVFYVINILVGSFVLIYVATIFTIMRRYYDCKLRVQTEQLRVMASTDSLTRLNNRREMNGRLAKVSANSIDSGKSYVIGIGDIDNFKRVNDTYGHDMGDDVLSQVAGVICENIPDGASASRWGGEEFLFVIPETRLEEARKCAENIIGGVSRKEFSTEGERFTVTMTIGICEGQPGENYEKIISRADSRLYKGKQNGKNRVEYED